MKLTSDFVCSPAQRSLISAVSILVPAAQRTDWRREWLAELWHVRHSLVSIDETLSWDAQREIAGFCLGALPDAVCLRRQSAPGTSQPVHLHGSAGQTLLWLATAVAMFCIIARLLPGVNAENEATRFSVNPHVLLINESASGPAHPEISMKLIRNWQTTRQRFFQEMAFYRVSHETAATAKPMHWTVAHSSANLFALLGVPILCTAPSDDSDRELPAAVLSHDIWMSTFAGDPHIAGRVLRTGSSKARIVGVAPSTGWQVPGAPDVWLLESESQLAVDTPPDSSGYLFARLSDRGQAAMDGSAVAISAQNADGITIDLYGAPIIAPVEGIWNIYKFALFLALVALPAVTSVSLGESQISSHRPAWKQRLWRVLFLAAKFFLVAALGLYASLDVAYFSFAGYSQFGELLQLFACFVICLMGFRWAVADQRQRCPMCLRRVTNPATVGLASRTFLGWNGTELICMGGHALLHVPSLPTSWFGGQRWLYLDSSWEFLFGDSYVY
ncbi:MAG TPA: hypothetical protein VGI45_17870 [Terracidiphilus sp.]|jgi:hypothetical protein